MGNGSMRKVIQKGFSSCKWVIIGWHWAAYWSLSISLFPPVKKYNVSNSWRIHMNFNTYLVASNDDFIDLSYTLDVHITNKQALMCIAIPYSRIFVARKIFWIYACSQKIIVIFKCTIIIIVHTIMDLWTINTFHFHEFTSKFRLIPNDISPLNWASICTDCTVTGTSHVIISHSNFSNLLSCIIVVLQYYNT